MINRRRPREKAPAVIFSPLPEIPATGGGTDSDTRGRRRRKPRLTTYFKFTWIAPLFILAVLLYRIVDWSFDSGVFMVGSLQSSTNDETNDDGDDESRSTTMYNYFPSEWETYSYEDIREYFDCRSRSKDNNKPLPTIDDWQLMRDTYTHVVDNTKTWDDDPIPPTLGYSLERGIAYPPPYYAKYSPGKGRGLFASRDIDEGELVHDGTRSDVIFPNALSWRHYIFSLPRELACDSTDWHWMQRLEEDGPYYLLAGINISSLMNSGGEEFGPDGSMPNALPSSSTSGRFYATRDIAKDEEILTDYDAYYTNWKKAGL